jgi:hypothetical protein
MTPWRYLLVVLVASIVAWPAFAAIRAVYNILPCRVALYAADENYIASCQDKRFGDFEHQVFYHGMLDTDRRLREADVLFLGDSRVGFAFSRSNVAAFFGDRGARFFIASFGYAEGWQFAAEVLKRHRPSPAVLVINVAPFFNASRDEPGRLSEPARYAIDHPIASYVDALVIAAVQPLYARLCPSCGAEPIVVRSRKTGQWDWRAFDAANGVGVNAVFAAPSPSPEMLRRWVDTAEVQARQLLSHTPARCIVLTDIPYSGPVGAFATELGARLGASVLLPKVDGLRSFDKWHLDGRSSIAWSDAFLAELDALVTSRCGGWSKS